MTTSTCIIGKAFNVPCNQHYLNAPVGSTHWHSISDSEKDEILLKSRLSHISLEFDPNSKICTHHKTELTYPSSKAKRALVPCVNPFGTHKKGVQAEVLKATTYFKALVGNKFHILPGQHVCVNCINKIKNSVEFEAIENAHDDWEPDDAPKFTKINQVCRILGLNEFITNRLCKQRIVKKAESKLQEICEALVSEFVNDDVYLSKSFAEKPFQKAKDHDLFFEKMKEKFMQAQYKEKIQLLTMIPQNSPIWTIDYTSKFFECSKYAATKSREVRDCSGFLAIPPPYKPKVSVSQEVLQAVVKFYKREDNVWLSPNVRDTKKIKLETGTEERRKMFLLHSLKELYAMFRKENASKNFKVGFSTFAKLRPSECELYGTTSLQNVCVCVIHGNIELMLSGIGEGRELQKQLIKLLVCDESNLECMIGLCEVCSKKNKLENYKTFCAVMEELLDCRFESGIKFATWAYPEENSSSKRIALVETLLPVTEYIEKLYIKFLKFVPHEYTKQIQSQSFQKQKREHGESTALVIGDFSENYTCVFQNEVQSAYFSKTQVTIHPFVAYVKCGGTEHVISSAVISDCLKHNTVTFYSFQACFLKYLCSKFPHVNHIEYWSDGCAAQYKNYKNFINLWHHKHDFGVTANWNFFATSHGKTGSDGVGATIKHRTRIQSLRHTSSDFIDSAEKVYKFCKARDWEIHPLFVSSQEVTEVSNKMELLARFGLLKTLPQTQKCHRIEIKDRTIRLYRTSISESPFYEVRPENRLTCSDTKMEIEITQPLSEQLIVADFPFIVLVDDLDLTTGSYVVIDRDGSLYVAKIADIPNAEVGTVRVHCLKIAGYEQTFTSADFSDDATAIRTADVISLVHPIAAGTTKRASCQLKLLPREIELVNDEHKKRIIRRRLLK